jgi:hypothetical protein
MVDIASAAFAELSAAFTALSAYFIAASETAWALTLVPICLRKDMPAWPIRHVTTLSSCEVEAAAKASAV